MSSSESSLHRSLPLQPSTREIRLLKVRPGQWDDKLVMDLFVARLDDRPQYSALSYVWGERDESTEQPACVNGYLVSVGLNLFLALRRLRAHAEPSALIVWADALCIDQTSLEERSQQVAMMGDIYRNCNEGIVWLGDLEHHMSQSIPDCWSFTCDDSDYTDWKWARFLNDLGVTGFDRKVRGKISEQDSYQAVVDQARILHLQRLENVDSLFHFAWFLRQLYDMIKSQFKRYFVRTLPHHFYVRPRELIGDWNGYWSRMRELFRIIVADPWFRRLWVVQELTLPRTVRLYFGPISIPLEIFDAVLRTIPNTNMFSWNDGKSLDNRELMDNVYRHLFELIILRRYHDDESAESTANTTSVIDLRMRTIHRDASSDHDQVYSVLGMSSSTLVPKYHAIADKAFTEVCRESILGDRELRLLSFAGVKHKCQEVPSWVIDWTMLQTDPRRRRWYGLWREYLGFDNEYFPKKAAVQDNPQVEHNTLFIDGAMVGYVEELLPGTYPSNHIPRVSNDASIAEVYEESASYLTCPRPPTDPYPGGWLWGEVWLRTLCLDLEWNHTEATGSAERLADEGMAGLLMFSGYEGIKGKGHIFIGTDPHPRKKIACEKGETPARAETATAESWQSLQAEWRSLRNNIEARNFERRFFMTEKGCLGCGNGNVQVGDGIFLLPGATVPIILRAKGSAGPETANEFSLASDAFILGLMDRELRMESMKRLRRIRIV